MFFGNPFGGDSNPFGDSIFGKSSSSLDIFGRKSTSVGVGSFVGVASTGKSPADEINKMLTSVAIELIDYMKQKNKNDAAIEINNQNQVTKRIELFLNYANENQKIRLNTYFSIIDSDGFSKEEKDDAKAKMLALLDEMENSNSEYREEVRRLNNS